MYRNNIVNFQESMIILNACTKKSGDLLNAPRIYIYIYAPPPELSTLANEFMAATCIMQSSPNELGPPVSG